MAASWKKMRGHFSSYFYRLLLDPSLPLVGMVFLFIAETLLNIFVINKIKYTEIDWVAYMQEVEGVVNGTYNYLLLKGDTGPLVYPAGFVYIYTGLYYITDYGVNIRLAQYIFAGIYLINLVVVFDIYRKAKMVPPYVFIFMCCVSYRIHSIYILRLFNDSIAMLFLYLAVNLILREHWSFGCLAYSMGVSVKMNVLLYAPGLLFILLARHGCIKTIKYLAICASLQVALALPFLLENPWGYMTRSFDIGRQFLFEWTVNWRCLPEGIFLHSYFHFILLILHVSCLVIFCIYKWKPLFPQFSLQLSTPEVRNNQNPIRILFPLFTSNFIGMCFSRSLHYQFYVWYFHSLHYLLWCTSLPTVVRILFLGIIELCWNTYPSTDYSSATLHVCHAVLLCYLFRCHQDAETLKCPKQDIYAKKAS